MKRTVFYSWQSDTDSSGNRNLIEDALKRALKSIKRDGDTLIDPVLDRDTSGVPGAPAITDTIFSKIAVADIFIADVTITNPDAPARKTANPNVLIELGFAISTLGWDRILLVQNTAFGPPEELPFDLRGRRIVQYSTTSVGTNITQARALLQGRLEVGLKSAIEDSTHTGVHAGPDVPLWWGTWRIPGGRTWGGRIFIREVGSSGFLFDMLVYNGAHTGNCSGFARLVGADLAYSRMAGVEGSEICEISFLRTLEGGRREIKTTESGACWYFRGMGASFGAGFVRDPEPLFERGVLDELDLARLYSITGQFYRDLTKSMEGIGQQKNLDQFEATVTTGGARGLYTIVEGIIMRGDKGQLWAAYIDDDVVRYFTTERQYRETLPRTIEEWRQRFKDKPVTFDSPADRITSEP